MKTPLVSLCSTLTPSVLSFSWIQELKIRRNIKTKEPQTVKDPSHPPNVQTEPLLNGLKHQKVGLRF